MCKPKGWRVLFRVWSPVLEPMWTKMVLWWFKHVVFFSWFLSGKLVGNLWKTDEHHHKKWENKYSKSIRVIILFPHFVSSTWSDTSGYVQQSVFWHSPKVKMQSHREWLLMCFDLLIRHVDEIFVGKDQSAWLMRISFLLLHLLSGLCYPSKLLLHNPILFS